MSEAAARDLRQQRTDQPILLLVEEDAQQREHRAALLSGRGYQVETAADLQQAAELCARLAPGLVLVGLHGSVQRVPGVIGELRAAFPGLRIVALMHQSHNLCAVTLDGVTIIGSEEPDDFLQRVASVLPGAAAAFAG